MLNILLNNIQTLSAGGTTVAVDTGCKLNFVNVVVTGIVSSDIVVLKGSLDNVHFYTVASVTATSTIAQVADASALARFYEVTVTSSQTTQTVTMLGVGEAP